MIRSVQFLCIVLAAAISCSALHAQTVVQGVGVGKPFSNLQDSIALNNFIPFYGNYPGPADEYSVGMVRTTAAVFAPGSTNTDGRSIATSETPGLYNLIGNAYGGNASAFNIPNTSARTIVGAGQAAGQPTNWTLGQTKGAATVTLKEDNLPPHAHALPNGGFTAPSNSPTFAAVRSLAPANAKVPATRLSSAKTSAPKPAQSASPKCPVIRTRSLRLAPRAPLVVTGQSTTASLRWRSPT